MKDKSSGITIGLDLGDRKHAVCVLDAKGEILKQESIANNRGSLTALSRRHPGAVMVMEVGMHSPWISRFLKDLGHRVLVANPRKVRAIYQNVRKSDRNDAELLARLARSDEKLLSPVEHVSEEMQRDLLQIKLRDNLVRQRVDVISSVRFTLKSLGSTAAASGAATTGPSLREPGSGGHSRRPRSLRNHGSRLDKAIRNP
jgi:transposase